MQIQIYSRESRVENLFGLIQNSEVMDLLFIKA
jgi:hypothetical protein